jgi:hypothetical protein
VRHEALQVSYPALERIRAAAVLVIVREVESPVLRLLVVLAGLEGAVLLEGFGVVLWVGMVLAVDAKSW